MQRSPTSFNILKVILLALALPVLAYSYEFGPPDAHTGGFGEPTCTECHFGTANSFSGKVTISISAGGNPAANYTSGTTYTIVVTDFDTAQRRWGFELSARTQGGTQAGTLIKGTDGFTQIASAAVTTITNPKIQYMEHTLLGTRNGTRDTGSGVSFTFTWTAPDVSAGPVVFNAAGNCANGDTQQTGDHIYTTALTLPPQAPGSTPPAVFDNGTVNGASFAANPTALAPGTIVSIFGTNLNDGSNNTDSSFGGDGKLLTTLGGASVTFNGISASLFNSFPGQLTVQLPWELAGVTSAAVQVTVGGQTSPPKNVPLGASSPGIFTIPPGDQKPTAQGAIQIANTIIFAAPAGSISGAQAAPAKRGVDFLTIYCTGLGAVNNAPATGKAAGSNPLSDTITKPQLTIGGVPAAVTFSGLSPGFVGLYQVNAQVPAGAPTGNSVPVVLSIGGVQANTVAIAVADSSPPPSPAPINLSGLWQGTWRSNTQGVGGSVSWTVTQSGSTLSGPASIGNSVCFTNGSISGSFVGSSLILTGTFPGSSTSLSLNFLYTATSMNGTYSSSGGLCGGDTGVFGLLKVS